MLGAVAGDVMGSAFEMGPARPDLTAQEVMDSASRFTDDTVLTAAVCRWLLSGQGMDAQGLSGAYRQAFERHPDRGYGSRFKKWAAGADLSEGMFKGSFGNGALMRLSPLAHWAAAHGLGAKETEKWAQFLALPTHSHFEALSASMCLARVQSELLAGAGPKQAAQIGAREYFVEFWKDWEQLRRECPLGCGSYTTAQIALSALWNFEDWESAVMACIRLGSDTDTYAAVAGGLAQCAWPVPEKWSRLARERLTEGGLDLAGDLDAFERAFMAPRAGAGDEGILKAIARDRIVKCCWSGA